MSEGFPPPFRQNRRFQPPDRLCARVDRGAGHRSAARQVARRLGRVGGNPGLRAGDPAAIRKIRASCDAAHLAGILAQSESWLPIVRRKRPDQPWGDVVRVLNRGHESNWTVNGSAAPSGGLSPRAWSRRSCWTARRGNWCGWQPASPRPRRTAHCNRLLLSSRPRGGTPPPSSTCWSERTVLVWPGPRQRR